VDEEGPANLTGNGMRMQYVLGRSVHEKYKDSIFKDAPKSSDYEVTSSQYERTMMSAYSHMMGIYPLGKGENLSNDVPITYSPPFASQQPQPSYQTALEGGYRPIPVNVVPKPEDDFFGKGMKYICSPAEKKVDDNLAT
jgi:hypothetical protein